MRVSLILSFILLKLILSWNEMAHPWDRDNKNLSTLKLERFLKNYFNAHNQIYAFFHGTKSYTVFHIHNTYIHILVFSNVKLYRHWIYNAVNERMLDPFGAICYSLEDTAGCFVEFWEFSMNVKEHFFECFMERAIECSRVLILQNHRLE